MVTGGGSRCLSELLSVPGASSTVLEAIVPYASSSLIQWLGTQPLQLCSRETVIQAGYKALEKAKELARATFGHPAGSTPQSPAPALFGLAVTAALATKQPKRGEHRAYIALMFENRFSLDEVKFDKGARSRIQEENLLAEIIVCILAREFGIEYTPPQLRSGDLWNTQHQTVPQLLRDTSAAEKLQCWYVRSEGWQKHSPGEFKGLLSGAFNPLHHAHQKLREIAEKKLKGPVYYEMPVIHADKQPLQLPQVMTRIDQFGPVPVVLTNMPLFVQKAEAFPETVFVVGLDTVLRLTNPSFYRNSEQRMLEALAEIQHFDCRFLVAHRQWEQNQQRLSNIYLPKEFRSMFEEIPPDEFLLDISSTQIREQIKRQVE